ncbi:HPF/RaiA family ribosome-associated protein [Candidatus Pacearchaeota archaeon]|nr:HPF/RaiA family ribosome-associated protein [Candidatus Pacearchaeota archaeon]
MSPEIEIAGLDLLSESEKAEYNRLIEEGFKKLKRKLKESSRLKIHIKVYSPEGNKRKFSLDFDLFFGSSHFHADSVDWDFVKAIHKAFEKLENQIEHKFHISDQKNEPFKKRFPKANNLTSKPFGKVSK